MLKLITRSALIILMLALNSCYVPDKFKAELRLSRYGDYALSFEGELIYMPIQHDYAEGTVKPAEEAERLENIRKDLVRDRAFTEVKPLGKGRFLVKYLGPVRNGRAGGRLGPNELVSIIRRDVHMLMIKSNPDNQVVILSDSIRPTDAQAMQKVNLNMSGEFRLTTDGNVIRNNATEVRSMGETKVYIWKIENPLSPMPHAIMIRDIDPERSNRAPPR
jgi:hypothetical protein